MFAESSRPHTHMADRVDNHVLLPEEPVHAAAVSQDRFMHLFQEVQEMLYRSSLLARAAPWKW